MLFLAALPPAFVLTAHFAPAHMAAAWAMLSAAALLACLCIALPGRRRTPVSLLAAALLCLLGVLLLPLRAQPLLAAMPIAAACLMLCALPLAGRAITGVAPVFYFGGIGSHLFVHAVIHFTHGAVRARYDALAPALTAALLVYLLLLFLSLNSISLDNATMARCRLPASMRRVNRLLTIGFLVLAAGLASLPAAARLIGLGMRAAKKICQLAGTLVTWLLGDAPASMGGGMPGNPMFLSGAEVTPEEPSLFSVLFEKFVTALALVIMVAGTLIILRFLLRRLYALSLRTIARLKAYAAAVSEDYEDEITDTREDGASSYGTRIRHRFAPSPMPDEPAARIRWRYARLLARNGAWPGSATARENLPQDAAAIYERARYSQSPVTQADAEQFNSVVRRL